MTQPTISERLIGSAPARRVVDAAFGWFASGRRMALDLRSIVGVQHATLLRLVWKARHTTFGRHHDFAGIRSVEDYQQRVPLRDYESFWREYWQPAWPDLRGATWPGAAPYLALSSGTTSGATKTIPVTRELLRSNRRAALTALSWFRAAHPRAPLFTGRMFFLGGSTDLQAAAGGASLQGDLSGIAAKEVPRALRPYTFPPLDLALDADWERKLRRLAEQSARLPITLLAGVPSWLIALAEQLRQVTGKDRLAEIWPTLRLVIHGGTKFDPYRALFQDLVGSDRVRFLETYPASEGFVAAEDTRFGLLRLIPDHNLFFEFVPVEELYSQRPTRHTVADLVPGMQYAVVLSTCAGLWSYVLGDTVAFERRDPPLLRFTGRTRQFLSAFGEHLIGEEVERAVALAARSTAAAVVDFHVGPVFPDAALAAGRHRYFVEFAGARPDLSAFARQLDLALADLNDDHRAHRAGDLTLAEPEIRPVRRGGFAAWMRARGQLGGQHKVPRMDNTGELTAQLSNWFETEARNDLSRVG